MKRFFLLLILLSSKVFAQEMVSTVIQDTLYFNSFYEVTSSKQADIVRIIKSQDIESGGYVFEEYDKSGKLEKSGVTKVLIGRPQGIITSYYNNGKKKDEGYFDLRRTGLWKDWYQNGQLKQEVDYVVGPKESINLKMINYFDSTGNHLVENGTGLMLEYYKNDVNGQLRTRGRYELFHPVGEWEGFHENGMLYYKESFNESGEFIKGESYDLEANRFDYTKQEVQPSPKGGLEKLYRFIFKKMEYPKLAIKNGVQGRVFVQFIVDKDGSIYEVETIKGISEECDKEAERVISLMENWNPGIQKGQPVKVRMLLPILFKLP